MANIKEIIAKRKEEKIQERERAKYHEEFLLKERSRKDEPRIAPEGAFISLVNINKIYPNHVQAVYDFNMDIQEKEFIVFVGPSGCGKSTTLRMIAGLEDITSGDLYLNQEYSNDLTPKERNIAMVFQSYALYPHMTVYQNMAFGLKINKYPKDEIDQRVRQAAEILELTEYLNRKPDQLSGGQCQRVALGRAIVRNSKIFLMDEPLSNLDAKLRVSMRSEIVKLHIRLGSTTIYVTHDQTEAMTMATRIVVMNKGYIQQIGTPQEIYECPANLFVATFIGAPAMNILDGTLTKDGVTLNNGYLLKNTSQYYKKMVELSEEKLDSYEVKVGVRPENITIGDKDGFTLQTTVCELLGSEYYLHFDFVDKQEIVAKVNNEQKHIVGETLNVSINENKIHIFDILTQNRL